ncbi:HD domain-containing protein [Dethiothermospora halolimnae]|uniref:HD domain-containing protein n=1 Tax=Dethiothermospora halolimnae TaxID=3114390 RepID=UPI003CCB77B1
METKIEKIKNIMKRELSCSAHNLDHVMRVHNMCIFLSHHEENVDLDVLIPAALLHDIARVIESKDKSGGTDHAILGSEMAEDILKDLDYDDKKIKEIKHCIITHRYRSGNEPKTIEAKILFDADKLDVIGSIGIARTFMLAGQFGQNLSKDNMVDDYKSTNTSENGRLKDVSKHSPFMEYEDKFKHVPKKLYTKKAKEIGEKRLKIMDDFFKSLELEIKGIE